METIYYWGSPGVWLVTELVAEESLKFYFFKLLKNEIYLNAPFIALEHNESFFVLTFFLVHLA